jgi:hypothetical protein
MALFLGGATSLLGSWAVTAACPMFLAAAVAGAVAMEGRELTVAEGLLPARRAPDDDDVDPVFLDAA